MRDIITHGDVDTVLGDFNNAHFQHHGITTTFSRRDNQFLIRIDGPTARWRTCTGN